jgi:hypothetical protein
VKTFTKRLLTIKQIRLKPLSQPIWQTPPLHPFSYQPLAHRRLLAFPVCVIIIGLMCQTYFVLTCTKYTVNRYPNKYIFNSIRISAAMEILIPSTASTATIFLILSYSHACSWLTSFKITSLQDRLYSLSVGIRGFLEFDIFLGHRQSSILSNNPLDKWCHSETSFLRRCETEKNLSHADGQQPVRVSTSFHMIPWTLLPCLGNYVTLTGQEGHLSSPRHKYYPDCSSCYLSLSVLGFFPLPCLAVCAQCGDSKRLFIISDKARAK